MRAAAVLLFMLACEQDPTIIGKPADPAALARDVRSLTDGSMGPVVLRGRVGQVCEQGCWFYLLDDTSLLFVQLDLATGLAIPTDSTGTSVLVKGRIVDESGRRVLHAETVVLGDPESG